MAEVGSTTTRFPIGAVVEITQIEGLDAVSSQTTLNLASLKMLVEDGCEGGAIRIAMIAAAALMQSASELAAQKGIPREEFERIQREFFIPGLILTMPGAEARDD